MELKEIREQINKLGTDMKAIMSKAGEEKRELSQEEELSFDRMDSERETLIKQERRQARMEELEKGVGRRSEPAQPSQETRVARNGQPSQYSMVEGIRTWMLTQASMRTGRQVNVTPEQRERATKMGFDLTARSLNMRLPDIPLQTRNKREVADWETRALSTLNTSSPVDGYYTLVNEMTRPLEEALLAFGGMRERATIVRTETGAELPWPTDNDTSNKGEIIAENSQVNEKDITFGQLTLNAFKYSSKMIRVSVELLQDTSIPNFGAYLGRKLGERIGRITNDHFTTGTGNSQPNGLMTAATASGTQLAAQTPTYAELVAVQHSVDPAYRGNGSWMFHDSMLAEIKKIVDASTGRPIWLPNMVGGEPDTILGDPYTVNQSVAAAAGSGAGRSIAYGDISKYLIRDVRDVTLVVADQLYANFHQVAFLAFSRHDGDLLDAGTHPVKYALNKA